VGEIDTKEMYSKFIKIAWPCALEGLLLSLMSSLDTIMVSRISDTAIASVSLCSMPRMLLLVIAQALCVGTTALVARRKGEENREAAISVLKQSLVLIFIVGIIITLLGIYGAPFFVWLAGGNETTSYDAIIYFKIIAAAFIANCLSMCICAAFRGVGQTKVTMVVQVSSNIINVILNYCLIYGKFGFPALGIKGAAIATSIGTVVGFLIALVFAMHHEEYLYLRAYKGLKFDSATLSGLLKVGSGSVAETAFLRLGLLLNGRLVAGVSNDVYTTTQIVQQISSLSFTLGDGAGASATSLIGQSLGAKDYERAKKYAKIGRNVALMMSAILIIVVILGRRYFAYLFTSRETIIYASSLCFIVLAIGLVPQNLRVTSSGCLRGAGDVKFVALISLLSVTFIRPLCTYLICYHLDKMFPGYYLSYLGPWLAFDIDALIRSILLTKRINKGEWVKIKL